MSAFKQIPMMGLLAYATTLPAQGLKVGNGSTSTSCTDMSHIVSITAGDLVDWQITPSAGLTYGGNLSISALWNCAQ